MFQKLGLNYEHCGWSLGSWCVESCQTDRGRTLPPDGEGGNRACFRHQQEGGWGDRALLHGHMLALHSGWISALVVLKFNAAVAVLMLLVALFFTGIAVLGIVMLKRVRGCAKVGPGERAHIPRGLGGTFRRNLGGPG